MNYDRTESLARYFKYRENASRILRFVSSVNRETATGKHIIDGERIFAFVSEYETKTEDQAVLEAHNKYLDIHFLVYGEERQEFYDRSQLKEAVPYDDASDSVLYVFPERKNELILQPGFFTLYFPDDAHATQLAVDLPEKVKKIVVKAKTSVMQLPGLTVSCGSPNLFINET